MLDNWKKYGTKVTVIPIITGALGAATKRTGTLIGGLGNKRTSGYHPNCWNRLEYWKESRRLEEICCDSNSGGKLSANAGVKNSQMSIIIIIIIIIRLDKLAQKAFKTRYDWVGKLIHWEVCKKLKFDHMNKWYMHNPTSVLEIDKYKLLWDFDIQTGHLISARRPDLIIIKKKKKKKKKENLQNCGLCRPGWLKTKTERMWKEG